MPNTPKLPEDWQKEFEIWESERLVYPFIVSMEYEHLKEIIYRELANLKAQVRKEIEEQITKMENSNWLHGMGLSGSQAEYIEANIKASYRSIPSLKGEE